MGAGVTEPTDVRSLTELFVAFDLLADPTFVVDHELRVVAANQACASFFGAEVADWTGQVPLDLVHPDDLPVVMSSFTEVAHKAFGTPIEIRVKVADGSFRLVEIIGATHHTTGGHVVVITMRDLTERRRWEFANGETELFKTVVEHAAVILALIDPDGRIASASGTFNRQLGHDLSRVIGSNLADWVDEPERADLLANIADAADNRRTTVFEATMRHSNGNLLPYQFSVANLLDDPVVQGLIVSANDISTRRALEARLTHMATTDSLTGLANRSALINYLATRLAQPRVADRDVVVYFVDLDRFKPINDLHGHDAGDVVLKELSKRLQTIARDGDVVARFGGDEFVVVCNAVPNVDVAIAIAKRIEEAVSEPVSIGATAVQVFASVGFAEGATAVTAEGLLAEADAAMYRVKQGHRGHTSTSTLRVAERRELAEALLAAIESDPIAAGLRVYFQPVVRIADGIMVGAEALVRWEHPTLGLLVPYDFLPVAEDAGLDLPLGMWILDASLAACASWPDQSLTVAVNFSAPLLAEPAIVEAVHIALERHGMRPGRLCIEVTENAMLERAARGSSLPAVTTLARLKHAGVQIAIDDFGTGYSSLAHVRELPADVIKVDRSFVAGMTSDDANRGIVAAVIALAHSVGMVVVAEGVESQSQHDALVALGADRGQGFHYGRPIPAADFNALIAPETSRIAS
jgi:diguanylate cyclase (GGDEF)-like protein/PAS domain S-box-containing protein